MTETMTKPVVTFPHPFPRLDVAAEKHPGRYDMTRIRVQGGKAIATDGIILAVVPVDGDESLDAFMPAATFKRARTRKEPLAFDGDSLDSSSGTDKVTDDGSDFPGVESVLASAGGGESVRLNAGHLIRLLKAIGAEKGMVKLTLAEGHGPVKIDAEDSELAPCVVPGAVGVIMPIVREG